LKAQQETRELPRKQAESASSGAVESTRSATLSDARESDGAETASDADLERAIVAAMLDGRGDVADLLTKQLRARQAANLPPNVVAIRPARA
jgi:hypothetical protein